MDRATVPTVCLLAAILLNGTVQAAGEDSRSRSDVTPTKSRLDYLGSDCVRDFMTTNVAAQASRFNRLNVDVIAICGRYFTTWRWEGNEASYVARGDAAIPRLVAVEG